MKEISLNGQIRTEIGKKASSELRAKDLVPCVIYGVEKDEKGLPIAKSFTVSMKELAKLLYTPNVYIVNLNLDGTSVKAILQELQTDFVSDRPIHVDFYQITESKPVVMEIPIKLNGLAAGVKAGGKLTTRIRKIKVKSAYTNFPDTLDIDVTNLGIGKSIKIKDLSFKNLEIVTSKEVVVCNVRTTRGVRSEAETTDAGK